jgi:hypothetical protein
MPTKDSSSTSSARSREAKRCQRAKVDESKRKRRKTWSCCCYKAPSPQQPVVTAPTVTPTRPSGIYRNTSKSNSSYCYTPTNAIISPTAINDANASSSDNVSKSARRRARKKGTCCTYYNNSCKPSSSSMGESQRWYNGTNYCTTRRYIIIILFSFHH